VIKSRIIRWVGHVVRIGERISVYSVFMGNPDGKRPFGRPKHRWDDNIKMHIQDVGCGMWTDRAGSG
jgi:hypothetical protein